MNPREFAKRFTDKEIIPEGELYTLQREYYLIGPETKELISSIKAKPEYLGTYLGKDTNEGFIPSFFLLELLKEHSKQVKLNERSSWLFVCGKNALFEGVTRKDELKNMDYVIVLGERKDVLGYGQYLRDEIRNLFDRGDFLRRERAKQEPVKDSRRPSPARRDDFVSEKKGRRVTYNFGKPGRAMRQERRKSPARPGSVKPPRRPNWKRK